MENMHLANRLKELRSKKGLSQEALAEEAGISHRTIQRIEKGQSNPTGDTLRRLSIALEVTPDELVDWSMAEDDAYLASLNLSALSFILFPILGILIPLVMWVSKKDKLKGVNEAGSAIINFEINWLISLVAIPAGMFLLGQMGIGSRLITFRMIALVIAALYLVNMGFIVLNSLRLSKGMHTKYYYFIKLLK